MLDYFEATILFVNGFCDSWDQINLLAIFHTLFALPYVKLILLKTSRQSFD